MKMNKLIYGLFILIVLSLLVIINAISEEDRLLLFDYKNKVWPPKLIQNYSNSYITHMKLRESNIMRIPGSNERWENWVQFAQSYISPKFTKQGFELSRLPKSVYDKLIYAANMAVENWENLEIEEGVDDSIYNSNINYLAPKMFEDNELFNEIHMDLLPLHENWAKMRLFPTSIYGIRFYRNRSSLVMHADKVYKYLYMY